MNDGDINKMPVRQASLGRAQDEMRRDVDMGGFCTVAKVDKVHHKSMTADVVSIRGKNAITGLPNNEGRYAAKILCLNANYDEDTKKSWGHYEPIRDGELVLIAFIDGYKQQPVILGSLHRAYDEMMTCLIPDYPIEKDDKRQYDQYMRVFPRQDYVRVDGLGNVQWVHHQKTFLKIDTEGIDDSRYGTEFHDLYLKDKETGETVTFNGEDGHQDEPVGFIFVQRDAWDNAATKWTKFMLTKKGKFRITRDPRDNTLLFVEVNEPGEFRVRRQLDSIEHDGGNNYTQIELKPTGEVNIQRHNGNTDSIVNIQTDGIITVRAQNGGTKAHLVVRPDGNIDIYADDKFNLLAQQGIDIRSNSHLNMHSIGNMSISTDANLSIHSQGSTTRTSGSHITDNAPLIDHN